MWLLGGACVVAPGGHAWLLRGGVRGCSWGGMHGSGFPLIREIREIRENFEDFPVREIREKQGFFSQNQGKKF